MLCQRHPARVLFSCKITDSQWWFQSPIQCNNRCAFCVLTGRDMNASYKTFLAVAGLSVILTGCVTRTRTVYVREPAPPAPDQPAEVVTEAPPPPQEEVIVASPGPEFVWTPGFWAWHGRWVWVGGRWARPPHRHAVWVAGHWGHRGHGYVWVGGRWR